MVIVLMGAAGCASDRVVRRDSPSDPRPAEQSHADAPAPEPRPAPPPPTPAPVEKETRFAGEGSGDEATRTKLAEDPHRKVPHASEPAPAPAATPRVRLPGSPEGARPALPETFRVAVALVREGRLARDERAFLAVARALEQDRRVKGVVRARVEADETDAKGLAEGAHREGARLLVLDVRGDAPLVIVCDVPSGQVLARLEGPGAKEASAPESDAPAVLAARVARR